MKQTSYYIAIKVTSPDDVAPAVDLMISSLPCKTLIHQYRGKILIFHVEPTGPIEDIVKKVRRLGRGKVRFVVVKMYSTALHPRGSVAGTVSSIPDRY